MICNSQDSQHKNNNKQKREVSLKVGEAKETKVSNVSS